MVQRFYRPIFSGNKITPTKVGELYRSSDIPLRSQLRKTGAFLLLMDVREMLDYARKYRKTTTSGFC